MKTLTLTSNAKVNLALDILGREPITETHAKGYHFIRTVLHEITPQNTAGFRPDLITIRLEENQTAQPSSTSPQIRILCEDPLVPTDESNLAYKAAKLIINQPGPVWKARNVPTFQPEEIAVTITIEKHIPVAQGFGGGSSNAAATLKGLNELLGLNLSNADLKNLAAEIGMDVPFFIEGGVALGEHFGERLTNLPPVHGLAFSIFPSPAHSPITSPNQEKTAQAYATLDLSLCGKNTEKTVALIHAIKTNDVPQIRENLHNDFETLPQYQPPRTQSPVLHLTGSGPGYFILV